MKKELFTFTLKDLTEIAIFTAMAIVADKNIKIPLAATGGSLNFSMVPIFVIALRHGPFKSFVAGGIIYGLMTCLLDGYGFNTYPLEYLVAYGSTCILGFFGANINRNYRQGNTKGVILSNIIIVLSVALWGFIRLMVASVDSVLFYGTTFAGGIAYNATYVVPSAILDVILLLVIVPPLMMLSRRRPSSYLKAYRKDEVKTEDVTINISNDKQDV